MPNNLLPLLGSHGRVLEAIITTTNEDDTINIAPMGPLVDDSLSTFVLRPFRTSTTYQNLFRTHSGVMHITDDVLLFAKAAIGKIDPLPEFLTSEPLVLASTCRWLKFEIESIDDSAERSVLIARTTEQGKLRDFFGFNRAKHAVIEAAILATRVHLLPSDQILSELIRLESPLRKTGSAIELEAFAILKQYVDQELTIPLDAKDSSP